MNKQKSMFRMKIKVFIYLIEGEIMKPVILFDNLEFIVTASSILQLILFRSSYILIKFTVEFILYSN